MPAAKLSNIIQGPWLASTHSSAVLGPAPHSRERTILIDQLAVTIALARTADSVQAVKVSFLTAHLGMDHNRILFALAQLLRSHVIDPDMIDFDSTKPLPDQQEGQC